MALCVGARYFILRTLYAEPLYWLLGAALALIGVLGTLAGHFVPLRIPIIVGMIEIALAIWIRARWKSRTGSSVA